MERTKYTQLKTNATEGQPCFFNNTTKEMFRIGQEVTILPTHRYSDGERFFTIANFSIAEKGHKPIDHNDAWKNFEGVYAHLTDSKGESWRDTHLDNLIAIEPEIWNRKDPSNTNNELFYLLIK